MVKKKPPALVYFFVEGKKNMIRFAAVLQVELLKKKVGIAE
jgi:hypothetical protein